MKSPSRSRLSALRSPACGGPAPCSGSAHPAGSLRAERGGRLARRDRSLGPHRRGQLPGALQGKRPSINNWPAIVEAVEGNIVADFPVITRVSTFLLGDGSVAAMFKILQKSFRVGTATADYPRLAPRVAEQFRGCPEFRLRRWSRRASRGRGVPHRGHRHPRP